MVHIIASLAIWTGCDPMANSDSHVVPMELVSNQQLQCAHTAMSILLVQSSQSLPDV
jgi:hypothetical protein